MTCWKRRIPHADEGLCMPTQFLQSVLALASSDHSDREASKGMQGCIKRMLRRGVTAGVVAMGQRGAGRSLRRMKVDRKRVFVLPLNMAPRATNSWLPRPPYPPPEPLATDCDSRGKTQYSNLSRHVDRRGSSGSFWPSQHVAAVTAFPEKA